MSAARNASRATRRGEKGSGKAAAEEEEEAEADEEEEAEEEAEEEEKVPGARPTEVDGIDETSRMMRSSQELRKVAPRVAVMVALGGDTAAAAGNEARTRASRSAMGIAIAIRSNVTRS